MQAATWTLSKTDEGYLSGSFCCPNIEVCGWEALERYQWAIFNLCGLFLFTGDRNGFISKHAPGHNSAKLFS